VRAVSDSELAPPPQVAMPPGAGNTGVWMGTDEPVALVCMFMAVRVAPPPPPPVSSSLCGGAFGLK